MSNTIIDINDDEFYQYYIVDNHSRNDTINHFHLTSAIFRKYVKAKGWQKVTSNNGIRHLIPTYDELYQKYIVENQLLKELSEYYGADNRTVNRWLRKYGIFKDREQVLSNMYNTNIEKYGSKTIFGTKDYKKWYHNNVKTIMDKVRNTCQEKYGANSYVESLEAKNIWKMGTSKTEDKIYKKLLTLYPDVIRWYKDERYPFECDYYIKDKDMFIEYQGFYTHGKEPFDMDNEKHRERLKYLQDNPSKHNDNEAYIWSERDVLKRNIAKKNGLNWFEFFTYKEFMKWYERELINDKNR